jgi:ActR/RegA family two-component response regulator
MPEQQEEITLEEMTLEEVEKRHIQRVLAAVGGNKSEAARRLGVSRKTLERKCAEWDAAEAGGNSQGSPSEAVGPR